MAGLPRALRYGFPAPRSRCFRLSVGGLKPLVLQGPTGPVDSHSSLAGGGRRADLLLRPDRAGPGDHPEDLLRARADGDRRARRLRRGRRVRDQAPAHGGPQLGHSLLRGDPPGDRLRGRNAYHRIDLGEGVVGPLVGVGRARARVVPDRLPPLLLLPAAALLYRRPREAGALRERLRHSGGRVRADQLHGRAARHRAHPPASSVEDGRLAAGRDAAHVPRLAARRSAAVRHALEGRADREERVDETEETAAPARGRRACGGADPRAGGHAMTFVLATAGDKYVYAAYGVFLAIVLLYLAIMATKLARIEREVQELADK